MPALSAVFLPEVIDSQTVANLTAALPPFARQEIERYVHVEDQLRSALGKWLIHFAVGLDQPLDQLPNHPEHDGRRGAAARATEGPASTLASWQTDAYGRPGLPGRPAFNLTHSGRVVALAYRVKTEPQRLENEPEAALGLDVERIKRLDFELFRPYMTAAEWRDIESAEDPPARFFHYWTAKEAVMKAEGLGFHLPIDEIRIEGAVARVRDRLWHLQPLDLTSGYAAHLATPEAPSPPAVHWLDWQSWG
jgi:phosphopantetheinyl transferase